MNAMDGIVFVLVPFVVVGGGIVGVSAWRFNGGAPRDETPSGGLWARSRPTLAVLGLWLVLTAMSLWCIALGCFLGIHLLLFWLGPTAAWAGIAVAALLLLSIPVAWGRALLR